MAFARVNGAVVHYADGGRRDARAIVFINSLGMDFRIWDDVARPLAAAYRVVRYDKRGHGLSQLPAGPALMADYAGDLAGLLDRQGVNGAVIVGVSMGGLIAQELYRLRPDLVAALVLSGAAAKIGTEESWRQRMEEVARGGLEAIADAVIQRWFTAGFRAGRPDDLAGWRTMLTRSPRDGYLDRLRRDDAGRPEALLRPHQGPDPVRVGDEDGSTPAPTVRELADQIGHARFEIIAGAGHLPSLEQADALRALIEAHARAAAV